MITIETHYFCTLGADVDPPAPHGLLLDDASDILIELAELSDGGGTVETWRLIWAPRLSLSLRALSSESDEATSTPRRLSRSAARVR